MTEMPDLKDIVFEISNVRWEYVDAYVVRRTRTARKASDEQVDQWEAEAVKRWNDNHPVLRAVWRHYSQQLAAKEASR